MTPASVVDLMHTAFVTSFWLSLPILAVGFLAGVAVSLAQVLTSIQDSSFSTVPRLTAFLIAMLLCMPWMLAKIMAYTTALFGNFARFVH